MTPSDRPLRVAALRRRLADRKAQMLRRWVAGTSDERLDSVMCGPLRPVLLWQIFKTMRRRVDAPGVEAVIEFRIRRPGHAVDRYQLVMADGRCTTTRDGEQAPTVALAMDSVSFLHLVTGITGTPALLLTLKLSVRGDLVLAARLPRLLNIPRAPGPARARPGSRGRRA